MASDTLLPVSCALCGSDSSLRRVVDRGQFDLPTHAVVCKNDGLVFLSPRWSHERYHKFYSVDYDRYYRPNEAQASDKYKYNNAQQICGRLKKLQILRAEKSVLDVGAGMGWSLDYFLRNHSPSRCAAIEASEACLENLRALKVDVLAADIASDWIGKVEGGFDLIVGRHVLEHFLDPVAALSKLREALAPGGHLYLAVPDMMHPRGSQSGYWFCAVHTYYFSKDTLSDIAGKAGLAPLHMEEGAELWGVFRASGEPFQPRASQRTYEAQMQVIGRHRRISSIIDATKPLKKIVNVGHRLVKSRLQALSALR